MKYENSLKLETNIIMENKESRFKLDNWVQI